MAKIKLKSYIKSVHGRIGNVIYYNVNGNQYARIYSIPRNPRTIKQQKNRSTFAESVKLWQKLSPEIKSFYNRLAIDKPMSGYNLFISLTMKGITAESSIQAEIKSVNNSYIPALYQIANNSVTPSILSLSDTVYIHKGGFIPQKPPGIAA